MKVLIIKRKLIKTILIIMPILILIVIGLSINRNKSYQTISPINLSKNIQFDLTGDGQNDSIELVKRYNAFDLNITYHNNSIYLSNKIKDNILFTLNDHWPPKIYLNDISRDITPEIIVQGSKNNSSMCYVFNWHEGEFFNVYSSDKNIFGILDSKNTKTPQCYSVSSSKGISSLNSFMLINNKLLDTTKENFDLPSLGNVTAFINLVETPYELKDLPDIFCTSINSTELPILWNLNKEIYSYSFQDAFFYDYEWDSSADPTSLKWRLTFEKSKLNGDENDKEEIIFYLDCKLENSLYKISSLQKLK
ncbi:hypothetical protein [Clostridium uliginosum]|uniref:Repeat domain-containing protein n=1 Tax=Clostridium uliginosum TaxID=119641 RepID=A0A1I1LX24_9CLOT|nr:hypothetical protein [Clostridium uliginosum]SFC77659.1 hypothetical protein SAMN05421842_10972 [Clostridium uliginosum]